MLKSLTLQKKWSMAIHRSINEFWKHNVKVSHRKCTSKSLNNQEDLYNNTKQKLVPYEDKLVGRKKAESTKTLKKKSQIEQSRQITTLADRSTFHQKCWHHSEESITWLCYSKSKIIEIKKKSRISFDSWILESSFDEREHRNRCNDKCDIRREVFISLRMDEV